MPKHDVSVAIPQKLVLSKDVEFEVKSDGVLLGNLLVSKGNLEWRPAKNSVHKHRLTWEQFDSLMRESGKKVKF